MAPTTHTDRLLTSAARSHRRILAACFTLWAATGCSSSFETVAGSPGTDASAGGQSGGPSTGGRASTGGAPNGGSSNGGSSNGGSAGRGTRGKPPTGGRGGR